MGFFKNLFGLKKEKAENTQRTQGNVVVVSLGDLEEWVRSNCSDVDTNYFHRKFSNILTNMKENLEKLSNIKFDSDTDPRVKQRVLSNIESYIKHARSFIKKTDLGLVAKDPKSAILEYENNLNNFNLQTQRNFVIISALFKDEAFRVANSFKEFLTALLGLKKSLLEEKSVIGLDIYSKIAKIKNSGKIKEGFEKEEKDRVAELENLQKELEEKRKSIERFTESKEYKDITDSDKRKQEVQKELENIKSEIFGIISAVEGPIKRLARTRTEIDLRAIELDRILDPENNKIIEYCKVLRENMEVLDIKEEKKARVLGMVDRFFDGGFISLKNSYLKKIEEIKKIDTMMIDSAVSKTFIDLTYKVNSLEYKKTRLESEIEKIKKRNEGFEDEFERIVLELEGVLSSAGGFSIKIGV